MRLERIFTHRLIRVLRVALPIVVVVLVAIPVWNYVAKRRDQQARPQRSQTLPKDLSVLTEGFTFSRTEGGRTLFTIKAKTNLGFKDNKGVLEDVDVTVFGKTDSEPTRRIRSKNCSYEQPEGGEVGDIRFTGAVEVQLDEKTHGRTEELIYKHRERLITTSEHTIVEQAGVMTAETNKLEYELNAGILRLAEGVKAKSTEGAELEAGSAVFHRNENWANADGGIFIKSGNGWIRGAKGRADLEANTFKPKTVTIEGGVTAQSQTWNLRANWMQTRFSAAGYAEHVNATGNVEAERQSGENKEIVTGGSAGAALDAGGRLQMLDVHENARMVLGSDRTLSAKDIFTNAVGSIETTENSVLHIGDSVIEGRQFTIDRGDIVTFKTSHRANLESGEQRSSADRTEARFDSRTNDLLELVQSGNFQFQQGERQGRAQNAKFEEGGTIVTLDGAPVVSDPQFRLEAAQIRLDQKNNSFSAAKNVKTVTKNSSQPVLVTANQVRGNADTFLYTGNVQLWSGNAYIKAEHLNVSTKDNHLHAEGKVHSNLQTIRATSDTLDYDDATRIAHYTGAVHAQKQDVVLDARDITVKRGDKDVSEIIAVDGVIVTQGDQRGTGDRAVYDAAAETVTLTGKPAQVVDKQRGSAEGARLIMNTSGNNVAVEGGEGRAVTKRQIKK